jgi:hypothetical protein
VKKAYLIGVLLPCVAWAGCSGNQSRAQHDQASSPAPAERMSDTAGEELAGEGAAGGQAAAQLVALLPADGQLAGWEPSREPRGFTADTLWEEIDGAADSYVVYGVADAVFADYRQAGTGHEAVIEIYQMKDPLNAFGKYAEERYPDYAFVQVGNEGYAAGNLVNFWTGPYYVKVRSFAENDEVREGLMKLAQSVAGKVTEPGKEPGELAFFPTKDQVARSARYIPKDVLSQSYLADAFQVEYKTGQGESKLLLIALASPNAAQDALTRYREAVAEDGNNIRTITAPGDGGFAGQDSFYGNLAAVRVRNYLAVALGTASEDAGKAQLAELVRNVR